MSEKRAALMDAILNEIIPPNHVANIPGAGELNVAISLAKRAVHHALVNESLNTLLVAVEEKATKVSLESVQSLERDYPKAFGVLVYYCYIEYYCLPEVRAALGQSAAPAHPHGYDVPAEPPEFLDELTAPVRSRGACYRPTIISKA